MKEIDLLTHFYIGILILQRGATPPDKDMAGLIAQARKLAELKLVHYEPIKELVKELEVDYTKFNLLYHITPIGNYLWNIKQLSKRLDIFGGERQITLAQGGNFLGLAQVMDRIGEYLPNCTITPIDNDPKLRETKSFSYLLHRAEKFPKNSYTFYAHTKGVTRGDHPAVKLWTTAMYHYNLDYSSQIVETLKDHPIAGCFKRTGRFTGFPPRSLWHYSGTFFWFRNKDLFAKPNWSIVTASRYGTEAYLSLLFKDREAGVLNYNKVGDMYNLDYVKQLLGDQLGLMEEYAEV